LRNPPYENLPFGAIRSLLTPYTNKKQRLCNPTSMGLTEALNSLGNKKPANRSQVGWAKCTYLPTRTINSTAWAENLPTLQKKIIKKTYFL
jgi:hypothetical protein